MDNLSTDFARLLLSRVLWSDAIGRHRRGIRPPAHQVWPLAVRSIRPLHCSTPAPAHDALPGRDAGAGLSQIPT